MLSVCEQKSCAKCPLRLQKPLRCVADTEQEWIPDVFTKECPVLAVEDYDLLLTGWQNYNKHGVYLVEGGLLKQSPKCLQAFKIISGALTEWQQKM